jgi:hypothetical protein
MNVVFNRPIYIIYYVINVDIWHIRIFRVYYTNNTGAVTPPAF